ncbi:hypothetical protein EXIGLDRAFT_9156 [Exidia glandulosa HHB12029]|uniref:Arrestin C-terminal-like domain-containing protein n=1 Tax=Exidia glandulosa HHB12029 TaxID=1314781 RepID=A0A166BTN7_EXIGL|nr:hypothetical protein EXIGLDRAFT_9156 [Exidia glandulosa HHB12029]
MPSASSPNAISKSSIELVVPPYLAVDAPATRGSDAQTLQLSGLVRLHIAEPTTFKDIGVEFSGAVTVMPIAKGRAWRPDSRIVYMSTRSLLDKKTTLKPGSHEFPFTITLAPDVPCTLPDIGGMAHVTYTLRGRAVRTGLWPNFTCERPVHLVRSYPRESVEFQNVYEAENVWRGKAIYSIALPHRAWAAGDTLMTLVKLVPLSKDAIPAELRLSLREDVRILTTNGPRSFTRHVATAAHVIHFPSTPSPGMHEQQASTSTARPPAQVEGSGWATPSDPGPFSMQIPSRTLPSYRNTLVTVRHHLDLLVRFRAPSPASSPGSSPISSAASTQSFAPEACSLSLGIRILSSHLLPFARQATLDNRRALFGLLPELMAMREQTQSGEDGEDDEFDLPSYANHVQDSIPFTPLPVLDDPEESRRSSVDTTRSLESLAARTLDIRRLSRVPDYGSATGPSAGVVPLSSVRGLPSYAEVALLQQTMTMQLARS